MPRLAIDLQGGFTDADVVVTLDDEEIHRATGVTSNPMTGFATTFDVDAPTGRHAIAVTVGGRRVAGSEFTVRGDTFVGLDAASGHVIVSSDPFGYS